MPGSVLGFGSGSFHALTPAVLAGRGTEETTTYAALLPVALMPARRARMLPALAVAAAV